MSNVVAKPSEQIRTEICQLVEEFRETTISWSLRIGEKLARLRGQYRDSRIWKAQFVGSGALPISYSFALKLISIYEHPVLQKVSHERPLPGDTNVLYALSTIPAPTLTRLIEAGRVSPTMTRAEVGKLLPKSRALAAISVSPPPRPVLLQEPVPHCEETVAPSDEELADLVEHENAVAESLPEPPVHEESPAATDEESGGVPEIWLGGVAPKKLSTVEQLQQMVTALEQARDRYMDLAHNRHQLVERKMSECNELQTQVRQWRERCQDLEACEAENERLRSRISDIEGENERLRERIAIMEESAS